MKKYLALLICTLLFVGCQPDNGSSEDNAIPSEDVTTSWLLKADMLLTASEQADALRYPNSIEVRKNESNELIEYRATFTAVPDLDFHFLLQLGPRNNASLGFGYCLRHAGYTKPDSAFAVAADYTVHYGYVWTSDVDSSSQCDENLIAQEIVPELDVVKSWEDIKADFQSRDSDHFRMELLAEGVIEGEMTLVDHYNFHTLLDARDILDTGKSYEISTEINHVSGGERYTHGLMWGWEVQDDAALAMVISATEYLYISESIWRGTYYAAKDGTETNTLTARVTPNYVAFFINGTVMAVAPKDQLPEFVPFLGYWLAHSHVAHFANTEIRGTAL